RAGGGVRPLPGARLIGEPGQLSLSRPGRAGPARRGRGAGRAGRRARAARQAPGHAGRDPHAAEAPRAKAAVPRGVPGPLQGALLPDPLRGGDPLRSPGGEAPQALRRQRARRRAGDRRRWRPVRVAPHLEQRRSDRALRRHRGAGPRAPPARAPRGASGGRPGARSRRHPGRAGGHSRPAAGGNAALRRAALLPAAQPAGHPGRAADDRDRDGPGDGRRGRQAARRRLRILQVDRIEKTKPKPEPRQRRAFSTLGGPIEVGGAAAEARLLGKLLEVDPAAARALTHGFHSYAGRMHPSIARGGVAAFSAPGERVVDPFCGSGTVLVEAMAAGRAAFGVDASALAVAIARARTTLLGEAGRERLVAEAARIAEEAGERARKRRRPEVPPWARGEIARFHAHVLYELLGLRELVFATAADEVGRALRLCLSSILVKFMKAGPEAPRDGEAKRIARGVPSRMLA